MSDHPMGDVPARESDDERIARIIAEYVNRLCSGEKIAREEVAAAYPDLAEEILRELETFQTLGEAPQRAGTLESLGGYRILRQVGRGGMGVVHEAVETAMDRHVALKVLPEEFITNPKAVARFVKEARVAGKLRHPNIVHIYGMGIDQGIPYYAMEFVEGKTLAEILDEFVPSGRSRSPEERSFSITSMARLFIPAESVRADVALNSAATIAVDEERSSPASEEPSKRDQATEVDLDYCLRIARAFAGVADGLAHAHGRGVIHRDVKPSNLILDLEGRLRILDFGLARAEGQESLTLSGDLIGTVLYMSPEQAMARRISIDHRTDIYSLGATLYEMLAWRPPFQGRDHRETLSQILFRDPTPPRASNPRIPRDLETIVLKCLNKDPRDRFATAEALSQDLRRFARGDPIEARPPGTLEKIARRAWRQKGLVGTVTGLLLFALAAALLWVKYREEDLAALDRVYESRVLDADMLIESGQMTPRERGVELPAGKEHERMIEPERGGDAGFNPLRKAIEILDGAHTLRPDRPEALFHRARALLILGREAEAVTALEPLATIGRADPRKAFAPARRLLLEIQAARSKAAPPASDEAPGTRPGADGWQAAYGKAHRASLARHREEAAAAYTSLLDDFGKEGEPYFGAMVEARLGRGRANLELEQLDESLIDFAAVEALHPAAIEPPLLLAQTLFRKGETAPARRRLESLQERTVFKEDVAERIARILFQAKDYQLALEWTSHLQDPLTRERWQALALVRLGRGEEARALAQGLVARRGDDPRSHHVLGQVLVKLSRFEEAVAPLEEAARLGPDEPRIWQDLAGTLIQRAFYRDHDYGRALEVAQRAAELDPRNPAAQDLVGYIHLQKEAFDEARVRLKRAYELDPRSTSALNGLGLLAVRTEDPEGAIAWYKKALAIDPTQATVWSNLGWVYCQLKRYDDGIAACKEALKHEAMHDEAWKILGNNYTHKNLFAEALAAFQKDLEIHPGYFLAHYNIAVVSEALGATDEALARYRKAMELNPAYANSAYNLGNLLEKLGRHDEAIAAYGKAIEQKPDWAWAHFNLAEVLAKVERLEEAAKHFARSVELDPSDPEGYQSLAGVYERQGKLAEARAILEKGLEAVPLPKPGEKSNEGREKIVKKLEELRAKS